jgi:hypothetical protein
VGREISSFVNATGRSRGVMQSSDRVKLVRTHLATCVGFESLTVVTMKNAVFWNVK